MKIAYVLNTYPQPSHSFIRREIRALEAQGLEVQRVAMRGPTVPLVDPQDIEEAGRTCHVLDQGALRLLAALLAAFAAAPGRFLRALGMTLRMAGRSEAGYLRHLVYLAEAAWIVRHVTCDHLHAHFGTNSAAVALLVHLLGGPGYSVTVHGPEEFDAPRALSLGDKLDRARFAVGVSQFGRSQLQRWARYETWPRLHVVPCGIDADRFADVAPLPEGPPRIVSIGRFSEQKGQLVLIEALARVPDLHLTLVGEGEMRGELEAAARRLGVGDRITFPGWLDEAGVRHRIDRAQALVMPSFAEGLPMVIMEAMAAGRPVISTHVAGIPELVLPGKTGWLVPAGDVDALAEALTTLGGTGRARLAEMGRAGRARALARHDVAVSAARLRALFEAGRERERVSDRAPNPLP